MSYFSDFKKDFLENVLMSSAETYKSRSRTLLIELANNPESAFFPILKLLTPKAISPRDHNQF